MAMMVLKLWINGFSFWEASQVVPFFQMKNLSTSYYLKDYTILKCNFKIACDHNCDVSC